MVECDTEKFVSWGVRQEDTKTKRQVREKFDKKGEWLEKGSKIRTHIAAEKIYITKIGEIKSEDSDLLGIKQWRILRIVHTYLKYSYL